MKKRKIHVQGATWSMTSQRQACVQGLVTSLDSAPAYNAHKARIGGTQISELESPMTGPHVQGAASRAQDFKNDPCVFLIDHFRSPSWDVYGAQWSVCIWVLGEFEYALDSSSQSENRAQNGVA